METYFNMVGITSRYFQLFSKQQIINIMISFIANDVCCYFVEKFICKTQNKTKNKQIYSLEH